MWLFTSETKPKRGTSVWAAQEKWPVHAHIRTHTQTCRLSEHPTHTHAHPHTHAENRIIRMDQRLGAGGYPDSPPSRPRDVLVKSGKTIYWKITASLSYNYTKRMANLQLCVWGIKAYADVYWVVGSVNVRGLHAQLQQSQLKQIALKSLWIIEILTGHLWTYVCILGS